MNAADIRNYLGRDWRLIAAAKSDQWTTRKAGMTPAAALAEAAELFEYVRSLRPDWPTSAEREADLESHIRVAGMLQRAAQHRAR